MNKLLLAYLAGVMDSDGYFTIRRSTYNIRKIGDSKNPHYCERVGIKQVQSEATDIIHKLFGGSYRLDKPNAKNGKPLYDVQLTNLQAHRFVKAIYPFLRLKRKQARILLLRRAFSSPFMPKKRVFRNAYGRLPKNTMADGENMSMVQV